MSKITEKVELAANTLIIIAAVVFVGVVVQKYYFSSPKVNQQERLQPKVGSKVNLQDVNFSGQQKTLVLALQTGCHFCNDSAPFYKRIIEDVKNKNVKLVAAFPGKVEESAAHLKELGLTNMEVKSSPFSGIQVSGTPTLILTNDKGEVTDYWVGKLTPDKEQEVINKLNL